MMTRVRKTIARATYGPLIASLFLSSCAPTGNQEGSIGMDGLFGAAAVIEASNEGYLHKLSWHLRGRPPEESEYDELENAEAKGQSKEFIDSKIGEYLNSSSHQQKMVERMEELFRFKTSRTRESFENASSLKSYQSSILNNYEKNNAFNSLVRRVVRENLSWDEILTGKKYSAFGETDRYSGTKMSDWGFLGAIAPDKVPVAGTGAIRELGVQTEPDKGRQNVDVEFAPDDSRIAGVLTTARFFNRYSNTALNKNRKRAAAVFRIFLCDEMNAAIAPADESQDKVLDLMFPKGATSESSVPSHGGMTEEEILAVLNQSDQRHGQQPDCMACHYKLDPLGKSFATSSLTLSPFSAPGALVFKKPDGTKVDVKGKGIGDIAKALTQQRQYVDCQVQHFWGWFMGVDQTLSQTRLNQLTTQFNEVGRRTNDFIAYLVKQPEFRARAALPTPERMRAFQVKQTLKNCASCHTDQFYADSDDFSIPDFTAWPIGGSKESMGIWARKIRKALDLDGDGSKRSMPPKKLAPALEKSDRELIKAWLDDGAPDADGTKLLEAP